ncbi:MAG: CDP-alcohol phosphatidyltransferase family protein [Calditrichaeota bacterium]|nr:CDP-alcohol phosphatidyltransferase family protein [Calditrichota bacterium]
MFLKVNIRIISNLKKTTVPKGSSRGFSLRKNILTRTASVLGADSPGGRVAITGANYLTILRLLIVPLFWICFFNPGWLVQFIATLLIAIGALTDMWDGRLARRRGQITPFGNFMDPLADKLLVLSAFWALLIRENLGGFQISALILVSIITLREIALTILRVYKIRSGSSLQTSLWGKWKTAAQLITILLTFTLFNLRAFATAREVSIPILNDVIMNITITILLTICMLTSVISGWLYLKDMFRDLNGQDG